MKKFKLASLLFLGLILVIACKKETPLPTAAFTYSVTGNTVTFIAQVTNDTQALKKVQSEVYTMFGHVYWASLYTFHSVLSGSTCHGRSNALDSSKAPSQGTIYVCPIVPSLKCVDQIFSRSSIHFVGRKCFHF